MLCVVGNKKVLHEVHLHAVSFSNGYRWEQVQKPVQNVHRRLREACGDALSVGICRSLGKSETRCVGADFGQPPDRANCDGCAKYLQVVFSSPAV